MISTQGVMQPGVYCPGIYQMSKCHLVDIPEPLVVRMRDHLQYQRMVDRNKTIYRVVDDLADWGHCCFFVKGFKRAGGKCTKGEFNKLFLTGCQKPATGGVPITNNK